MSFVNIPERTTSDANSFADINQLQLNIEALKGGDAHVTTIKEVIMKIIYQTEIGIL